MIRREWRNEWEFNLFYKKIICVMTCVKIVLSTICIKNKYPFFVLFVQGYFDNLHDICGIIFCDIKRVRFRQIRHLSLFEFSNCWFTQELVHLIINKQIFQLCIFIFVHSLIFSTKSQWYVNSILILFCDHYNVEDSGEHRDSHMFIILLSIYLF